MLLHRLITDGANRRPDHIAFHWVDRNKTLTYAETADQIDRLAGAFHDQGARKGDRITIFAHNGIDYLLSMFAAWRIGAIAALVNVKFADELDEFLCDHTPKLVVYTHDMADPVRRAAKAVGTVSRLICMDGEQEGAESLPALLNAGLTPPDDPADVCAIAHLSYTSGTTGKPKGACLAHEPTIRAASCIGERLRHTREDYSLGPSALSSSYQLVGNILPTLKVVATCAVMKDWTADTGFQALRDTGATVFVANPTFLTDVLEKSRAHGGLPKNLRIGLSGGGPVPPSLKLAWRDELKIPLVESYGQSELGGFVALGEAALPDDDHIGAVGRPLPDKEVRILDKNDCEFPIGQVGEICLRGGFMAKYWGQEEKTAETLRNGWLHTGDVGVMAPDSYVTMRGRVSELIHVNGDTWFPRDIEEAIAGISGVREVAVVGLGAAGGGHRPIAFFTGSVTIDMEELKARISHELPYDLSTMIIQNIDVFPMTPTGKIAKATLRDNAAKEGL